MTTIFGFETGNFINWNTIGDASIETTAFGSIPSQGKFQALITNDVGSVSDSALENFLGFNPGSIDGFGNGDAKEGSALKLQPITVNAGDVLSFDFNFLTDELTPDSTFKDFAFVSIIPNVLSNLADTNSSFLLSPTGFREETDYDTFTYKFPTAGTYLVGMAVVDVEDELLESALLVDNLRVVPKDEVIVGTSNGETLFGTADNDTIYGQGGNDRIFGSEGVNILYGGAGDDEIFGGSNPDTIYGGTGNDEIFSSGGNNTVYGGIGNDLIDTGTGNDLVVGGFGNDTIRLGGGQDIVVLEARKGTDTIINFKAGKTSLGLSGGLTFSNLRFNQSADGVEIAVNNEVLAVVNDAQVGTIASASNFLTI
ncbi:calcium-binding protein [Moorena producens]|uniref:calcium-binding protein n=1 Tax=Moorena producens TaxID=1155739 RepID=UPI003C77E3EE